MDKKRTRNIVVIIITLILIVNFCNSKTKDYRTYNFGEVVDYTNERIVAQFELLGVKDYAVNAFSLPEGENTGYVKLVYISKEEFDSLNKTKEDVRFQRKKTKKRKQRE